MNRRTLIAGLGSAAAWPIAVQAQQSNRVRRIAVLYGTSIAANEYLFFALRSRLEELGWSPERNVRFEVRWGDGNADRMRGYIAELLAWSPDIFFVYTNLALALLKPLARDLPVVFTGVGDPVGSGFVASMVRPGGNVTGFESFAADMGSKWLELLKDAAPHVGRVLVLLHPETQANQDTWRVIQEAAPRLGVEVSVGGIHDIAEIERTISAFAASPNGGIISLPHAITTANNELIVALELRYRLPGIHTLSSNNGPLVSYAPDWADMMRRAAGYVDRILLGASPADLPVQAPSTFEMAINLRFAKAIGLDVPPIMVVRADKVIE